MLVIQNANLTWHKTERGGAAAAARNNFPFAYPLPEMHQLYNVWLNCLNYYQYGERFYDSVEETRQNMPKALKNMGFESAEIERRVAHRIRQLYRNQNQFYNTPDEVNLPNLILAYCGENLQVNFAYDERRSGQPRRRGHNKDFNNRQSRLHGVDCLNETAFLLEPGEYGRVIWNERNVDYDTGGWYYQLHIYNIFCWSRGVPPVDILVSREPDFEYLQLEDLY